MKGKIKSNTSCVRFFTLMIALTLSNAPTLIEAKLADRGRIVKARNDRSKASLLMNSRVYDTNTIPSRQIDDNPIEGPKYRGQQRWNAEESNQLRDQNESTDNQFTDMPLGEFERELSSQLTGCCYNWQSYSADSLCYKYGQNCATGAEPSNDSSDSDCGMEGLSFIGISFSVNTASGNPYSYQLCDQFPMENIIDRTYDYAMSLDEDGWLIGGGYKSFDYSGKMPYIDSSHTELIRIGALDADYGGTTIDQVYSAMSSISFAPLGVFPEYVKGGGNGGSGDDDSEVPSGDVTLVVSVVEEFEDNCSYSLYEQFLDNIFNAMDAVNGGPCMDDHDTDPHVSMSRGLKFKSSYHEEQYFYSANLEVAVWQSMYPNGVVIGSSGKANFPPEKASTNRKYVGYGNLYFFFDRANITKAFPANRDLYSSESYYSTLTQSDVSGYYSKTTSISFDYSSGSGDSSYYEHNPYAWNAGMAMHDMTDGWDLPPNCDQEGETFLGIPLSRKSGSKLQTTSTFQNQFDFDSLVDRNFTYMKSFGTNHGWLVGEELNNGPGSIVDKDTAHIPVFYTGTTNPNMGGMALSSIIKVLKNLNFGTLYIKPAFLFQDEDGAVKLQFEADANSALGYLYDNLCKMLGLSWNYNTPSNKADLYTNCAMHASGDRASYGCGPDNTNAGGFCPQMTIAYAVAFQSEDHAAAFFSKGNDYVDYWRSLYPSGVAVGTNNFCKNGGCLGLFLNRYDLYQVFKPDLGGSWVEYNGATLAPTISPAPTYTNGCKDSRNSHLDKCFRKSHPRNASAVAWNSLGPVGQISVYLLSFMAVTLSLSIFLARARKKRRRGESYVSFLVRDIRNGNRGGGGGKKKKSKKKKRRTKNRDLEEDMLGGGRPPKPHSSRSQSKSRSKSRSRRPDESSSSKHRSSSKVREGRSSSKSRDGRSHSKGREESSSSKGQESRSSSKVREGRSSSKAREIGSSSKRHEEQSSSKRHEERSSSKRREEGSSGKSSSKHRSSSKRRSKEGEHRSRSSSRRKSSTSGEERSSSSKSGRSRSRSRSRSRREGASRVAKPDEDTMAKRQLV